MFAQWLLPRTTFTLELWRDHLDRLDNILVSPDHQPIGMPERVNLINESREAVKIVGEGYRNRNNELRRSWMKSQEAAYFVAHDVARKSARSGAFALAHETGELVPDLMDITTILGGDLPGAEAKVTIRWAASWIVVEDLLPPNPFEPLLSIYELGCWTIGIIEDTIHVWAPISGV